MSFNWGNVGTALSGVATAIAGAGVTPGSSAWHSILASIGLASNPNQSEELALCSQILIVQSQPQLVAALAQKLETEQGVPAAALPVMLQLTQPGVDVTAKVQQIQTIIRNGG
jgi:hypothetical protein